MSDPHPSLDRARAVHADVLAAVCRSRKARYDLANLLRRLADERLHLALGYASLGEYAEATLDLPRRAVRELVSIARSLADLPALDAALAGGEVAWSKAREIVRVATPATDGDWVAFAAAHSTREVEAAVVQAAIGERPEEPPPERGPARRRVTFMMEASDAEILHQALGLIRHQTGEAMDGVALAALAARFLSDAGKGEDGPTGEPYRIALAVCPGCGDCHSHGSDISEEIATEVACDAEVVDLRPGPDRGRTSRAIPARVRAAVLALAGWRCEVPGCTNCLWLHIHHPEGRGKGHIVEQLVRLCSIHHRLTHQGRLAVIGGREEGSAPSAAPARAPGSEPPRNHRPCGGTPVDLHAGAVRGWRCQQCRRSLMAPRSTSAQGGLPLQVHGRSAEGPATSVALRVAPPRRRRRQSPAFVAIHSPIVWATPSAAASSQRQKPRRVSSSSSAP